ncbi:DASH complex subunit Dam1-domain-containing protein [Xylaria longipes]|nr:DASH complex subunit Dam1-domain-containing protein [Xylaria longipes]
MSASEGHDSTRRPRSNSRSRPTTPLRPSSRSSFRESAQRSVDGHEPFPLNEFEPAFAELSDAVADLEANMMHFQLMHESLARFGESFASFLYGLNMNAFCVDFPEAPIPESFRRARQNEEQPGLPTCPSWKTRQLPPSRPLRSSLPLILDIHGCRLHHEAVLSQEDGVRQVEVDRVALSGHELAD